MQKLIDLINNKIYILDDFVINLFCRTLILWQQKAKNMLNRKYITSDVKSYCKFFTFLIRINEILQYV